MAVKGATKFVVLTSQRSGSTWLIDTLSKFDDTTAYGELFLPEKRVWDAGSIDYPRFVEAEPERLAVRPFSVLSYLDGLYRKPGAVGFKLMYSQLRAYPEILAYLCWRRVHVVHLVRRNHLDVVISAEMSRARGRAHVLSEQQELNAVRIQLNPKTLIGRMKRLRRNITIAQKLLYWCRLPHLEVAYEDLLGDQSYFGFVWDFLSVNPEGHMPKSSLVKIRRAGHAYVIANYDEVEGILTCSAFAELIE